MFGFTSTSMDETIAMQFLRPEAEDYYPILFKIKWNDLFHHYHISKFSAYEEEKEVILSDGVKFVVESIEPG